MSHSKTHISCSPSAGRTDARIIWLLAGTQDLWPSAHLACFPHFAGTHASHTARKHYPSRVLPAVFTCLLFSFCFSYKKAITRLLFILSTLLRVRKASLFVTQRIWCHGRTSGSGSHRHFVLCTYGFWCAVRGMPGVVLLLPGATQGKDSFQAKILYKPMKKRQKRRDYGRGSFRSKSSKMCGATHKSKHGPTPVSSLHPFIQWRTAAKQISSFLIRWRCFRFVFMRISAPPTLCHQQHLLIHNREAKI